MTACNRFGESAASASTTADVTPANVTAGAHVPLTVVNAASIGANPPEFFIIYRSNALASGATAPTAMSSYSEIARVRCTLQTAAGDGATFNDVNLNLPFTETAYLGELTPSVLTFRQLAPLMRMDLAVLAPAYRWMVLMYGTPILFAPRKWVRLTNVGRLT